MARFGLLSLLLLAALVCRAGALRELGRRHAASSRGHVRNRRSTAPTAPVGPATPGAANCTLLLVDQQIDHFSWAATPTGAVTYKQRVFVYDRYWDRVNGSIWLYAGNEADVTLYADHSGLMWENAQSNGALLVFAEHRWYGSSLPCGEASPQCIRYLTHEQAQADLAALALHLRTIYNATQPVILFGGSYGGMLAAWTRFKYPGVFAGAVAASAPILAFQGQTPQYDPSTYWTVVTRDATPAGGSAPACAANIRAAWEPLFAAGATPAGRAQLAAALGLCAPPPDGVDGIFDVAMFLLNAWDTLAMGDFPYPSNYLTSGGPLLPAWPFRVACEFLATPSLAGWELLAAVGASAGVFNNATADVACYNVPTGNDVWEDGIWDYQWCTETLPEETFFPRTGTTDMFWPFSYNNSDIAKHCSAEWGVTPRFDWIAQSYGIGGPHGALLGGSNVVFSNGAYDPWSSGGVVNGSSTTGAARPAAGIDAAVAPELARAEAAAAAAGTLVRSTGGLTTVWIPDGAHHVDLFFANAADPASIVAARDVELALVRAWVAEWYQLREASLVATV